MGRVLETKTACVTAVLVFTLAMAFNLALGSAIAGPQGLRMVGPVSAGFDGNLTAHGPSLPPDPWEEIGASA